MKLVEKGVRTHLPASHCVPYNMRSCLELKMGTLGETISRFGVGQTFTLDPVPLKKINTDFIDPKKVKNNFSKERSRGPFTHTVNGTVFYERHF